jgi:glycosyltransferase involved in cell wall biosynthesis
MATISCVIPTIGREQYLVKAIESVLAQSTRPHEIIIVHNGQEKLSLPEQFDSHVKIFNIVPKAGPAQARNFGASIAVGTHIAFLDDDDLWHKNYLGNATKAIDLGAECVISRLDQLIDGQIKKCKNAHNKLTREHILIYNPGITGTNLVISKESFFKLGGFDPKLPPSEDKSLILEALKHDLNIHCLPENQAIIRTYSGNRETNSAKMAEGVSQFMRKYKHMMTPRQRYGNRMKIYRHRYDAGDKYSLIPFSLYYLITRIYK